MNPFVTLWLRLTGGEAACPRARFALTMLVAYATYHLLLPRFIHCLVTIRQHGMPDDGIAFIPGAFLILGLACAALSLLLAFLPLSPLALLGVEVTLFDAYRLIQGPAAPAATAETPWLSWLGLILGAPTLLLAGAVAFCAAWRRLKDAGRSPLFLLLGLTYLLGFDNSGSYSAEAAGIYLLGPLWLIILYSQPGKGRNTFALFRTPPPAGGLPAAPAETKEAPAVADKQRAPQEQKESSGRLISLQPSRGKNRSSAATRPSPANGAESYRRRMRKQVQAARRRS